MWVMINKRESNVGVDEGTYIDLDDMSGAIGGGTQIEGEVHTRMVENDKEVRTRRPGITTMSPRSKVPEKCNLAAP